MKEGRELTVSFFQQVFFWCARSFFLLQVVPVSDCEGLRVLEIRRVFPTEVQ